MSQTPVEGTGGDAPLPAPSQARGMLGVLQEPRVLLFMLAGWSLMSFLTELFIDTSIFVENHGGGDISLDGVFGGLALNWEGIPLAVLYIYCARDPHRFRGVFWLALIALLASVASNLYHLIVGTYSIESVFLPIAVSGGLALLVFVNLFNPKEEHLEALRA
jgi:hypothetical protein